MLLQTANLTTSEKSCSCLFLTASSTTSEKSCSCFFLTASFTTFEKSCFCFFSNSKLHNFGKKLFLLFSNGKPRLPLPSLQFNILPQTPPVCTVKFLLNLYFRIKDFSLLLFYLFSKPYTIIIMWQYKFCLISLTVYLSSIHLTPIFMK